MEGRSEMITIKLFSALRRRYGKEEIFVDAKEISMKDLIQFVDPGLAEYIENGQVRAAVNHEFANLNKIVRDGDEVALFPPVSGG